MISFRPLADTLKKSGHSVTWLKTSKTISGDTFSRLAVAIKVPIQEGISISTIDKLCKALGCTVADVMEYVPDYAPAE